MAKHITICCNSFPPEKGGAPTRIYNMALLLRDAGYEMTVITAMPNYPTGSIFPGYRGRLIHKETMDGIKVVRLWMIPSNSGNLFLRAFSLLSYFCSLLLLVLPRFLFKRADVVIVSSPPLISAWAAGLLARISGKKIVVNISDIWPLTVAEMGAMKDGFLFRMLQKMERGLYRMARAYTGQSGEILTHIHTVTAHTKPEFLYRNLQPAAPETDCDLATRRIIYAGNLGHAQGMLDLCRQVDFRLANAELHIYGDGAEREALSAYLASNPGANIFLHKTVPQPVLNQKLAAFNAVLIPLKTGIHGAVPSKLFMAVAHNLPVLFCGGGEGETFVSEHKIGWVSPPGDYISLAENIRIFSSLPVGELENYRANVKHVRTGILSKTAQDEAFVRFIHAVCS